MISAVIEYENNKIIVNDNPIRVVGLKFEKGFYEATVERDVLNIERKFLPELHTPFKSEENESILNTVKNFFKEGVKDTITQLGFVHKLGILAYGDPGCGKTSLLNYIANTLVEEHNAIVFFCNNANSLGTAMSVASRIRQIQDEPIVFIADEFDKFASQNEAEMKNLLDGKDSVENSLFLATTNYIERIPDTLKKRPSRFRIVKEIKGITDIETMKEIAHNVSNKISPSLFTDEEIDELFEGVTDITLDKIKQLCLDKVTSTLLIDDNKKSKLGFKLPVIEKKTEEDILLEEINNRWVTESNDSISTYKDSADKA